MSDFSGSILGALVLLALVLGVPLCWSPMHGGDIAIGYPHTIVGEVTQEPSVRYVRTETGGQEKVSISLALEAPPAPTLAGAYADGVIVVECLSTRCTQVQVGEVHELACRGSGRWLEPNVAVCKHARKR